MKITVIGSGNIGTLMAAEMAHRGHAVTIYTSKPEKWQKEITVFSSKEKPLFSGTLAEVTSDLKQAIRNARLIWITLPAQLFSSLAQRLSPLLEKGQIIGIVPGSGGAEFAFHDLIKSQKCTFFGLQRVHCIARLREYGKSVYMLGRKKELQLATIPAGTSAGLSSVIASFFEIPCIALPNYLCVTLTPSNPILHTTRLYSLFRDYKPGRLYFRNVLFYEDWDDEASGLLIACDNELQRLCKAIPMDLTNVKSLKVHYESQTITAMTRKISGIAAFKGLLSPMERVNDSWIPDFTSRYFTADFSYGLKVIKDISALFGVRTPCIDKIWNWYLTTNPEDAKKAFSLKLSKDEFLQLYR